MWDKWFLVFILILSAFLLSGQDATEKRLSGTFQGQQLSVVLDELGKRYDAVIYYQDQSELRRTVSISYENQTLNEVLDQLLSETTLGHIAYRDYAQVVMPRLVIDQSYSSEYYQALESNLDSESSEQDFRTVGQITELNPNGLANVTGVVMDAQIDEPIIGATVFIEELNIGTTTELDGSFILPNVPAGRQEIRVSFVGYTDFVESVEIQSDGDLPIQLYKNAIELTEVTIRARAADAGVRDVQIGVETMDIQTIEKLPTFLGEVDVVKSFLLQPGVSTVGEGASGFNVRGGNVDQNLILQDEAILFNSSHALGFFSTFNSDLIRQVDLYKGNIPAQFGGRLVSVLDVEMRDGNFERFKIKGGVGPVSSKISLEGPIVKDKVSFIGGFRSSYTDWLFQRFSNIELQRSSAFFYDGNFRITAKPNEQHSFILSGYTSQDDFSYNEEFGFDYSTQFGEFTYKYLISDKMINNLSVVASRYNSSQLDLDGLDASQIDNNVSYLKIKEALKIVPSDGLELNVGASMINYFLDPGDRTPLGENSIISTVSLEQEKGRESSVFGDVIFNVSDAFQISGGARFAYYQFLGPHNEFQYENPDRPSVGEISGTELKTGTLASYSSIEPRVSMRLNLNDHSSVKLGYSRTAQFISQIFNTDAPTPSSQWQLSTRYIKPFRSHNASVGIFRNSEDNGWETSLEVYARQIDQLFDFVDFATLLINDHLETDLVEGEGRAVGAEVSIKKHKGDLTGWLSYTYSRSQRRIPEVNSGEWYFSNFDKTHDASLILNYNPNQRNTFTVNLNYSTGRPATPPVGNFVTTTGVSIPIYSQRNSDRIPDYLRLDLAYTIGQGYKKNRKFKTSWTFSIYNVLGRKNPFSVFFTRSSFDRVQANRLAIIGSVFPSMTVNFELL